MSTEDFIASCLMVPTKEIDRLCDEYDVDFSNEDVYEMLNNCAGDVFHEPHFKSFGAMLVWHIAFEIAAKYTDVLEEDKLGIDFDGCEVVITYDDVLIESKKQLDEIYNMRLEQINA